MTPLTRLKLGFALAGLATFAYGVRVDAENVRLAGIALVAIASFLRFVRPREP